jgi:F0F1-type ATP synthase membrane subunit b/b'
MEETANLDQAEKYQQLLSQVEAEHARNTEEAKHRLSQIDAKVLDTLALSVAKANMAGL